MIAPVIASDCARSAGCIGGSITRICEADRLHLRIRNGSWPNLVTVISYRSKLSVSHCQHRYRSAVPHSLAPQIKSNVVVHESFKHVRRSRQGCSCDHDLWFLGYGSSMVGSPVSRMKLVLGELLNLSTVGDDAWTTYGRAMRELRRKCRYEVGSSGI